MEAECKGSGGRLSENSFAEDTASDWVTGAPLSAVADDASKMAASVALRTVTERLLSRFSRMPHPSV